MNKDFLKNRRLELGLTLDQMADRLNTGSATPHNYETGKRYPKVEKLLDIKEAYQLTDEELLDWIKMIAENRKNNK